MPAFSGTVSSVKLRLFVDPTGTSTNLQTVYAVADNTWTETGITWTNAPAIGGSVGIVHGDARPAPTSRSP